MHHQDQKFERIDVTKTPLEKGEFENCTFTNCDFSSGNLSDFKFIDCEFQDCNLSLALLHGTAFRNVVFKECKMLGLQFENCNDFGLSFSFENCQLNHSTFFQMNIKKTIFKNCILQEVDFSESNLTSVLFGDCDLSRSIFKNCILDKADFRTAFNYSLDPQENSLRKTRFSSNGLQGLLDQYDLIID